MREWAGDRGHPFAPAPSPELFVLLIPAAVEVPALVTAGLIAGIYIALVAYESTRFAEARERVRHQLESELGAER